MDPKAPDAALIRYLAYDSDKEESCWKIPSCWPPQSSAAAKGHGGYRPEIWEAWIREEKG